MPKIITSEAIFNPVQNALVYWCKDFDGNFWIRSASGNWAQLDLTVASTEDLDADFQAAQTAKTKVVSPATIITDNNDQAVTVVPVAPAAPTDTTVSPVPTPITIDPAPAPAPATTTDATSTNQIL